VIHPKTLLISRHFYSLQSYVWRSIYNLNIDTISTYYISLDRSFLKLCNDIRHVMPSTDRRIELNEKASMAQNAWQAFVYSNGLICQLKETYPILGPPCVRSNTCLGFRSHWNFCINFAPWLPPDFGLMNTSTGFTLADGIGFITNVFWSFSFWNKYV